LTYQVMARSTALILTRSLRPAYRGTWKLWKRSKAPWRRTVRRHPQHPQEARPMMTEKEMRASVERLSRAINQPGLHLDTRSGNPYRYTLKVTMLPGTGSRYFGTERYYKRSEMEAYLNALWDMVDQKYRQPR